MKEEGILSSPAPIEMEIASLKTTLSTAQSLLHSSECHARETWNALRELACVLRIRYPVDGVMMFDYIRDIVIPAAVKLEEKRD